MKYPWIWALGLGVIFQSPPALSATYYVGPNGGDSNIGTSTTAPFLTISHAASITNPGDTVDVMPGNFASFNISRAGTAAAWITYKAEPGATIQRVKNGGIGITPTAAYITVQGFTVHGNMQDYTIAQATAAATNDPLFNGHCIGVSAGAHHVRIIGNTVSFCPGAGIMFEGDYGWISGNDVFYNTFYSPSATSGIDIDETPIDSSGAAKLFVYDNVVHGNVNFVCNRTETNPCRITDGHGILVDSNALHNYYGRTEIYNNLVYQNGCKGIGVGTSWNVDVYNNTTYDNNQSATEPAPLAACQTGGEIVVVNSSNVRVENNVMWGNPAAPMESPTPGTFVSTNLTWDYNIMWGAPGGYARGPHDLLVDPLFSPVGPGPNFHLLWNSPGIGTGTNALFAPVDLDGVARNPNSVERGAY